MRGRVIFDLPGETSQQLLDHSPQTRSCNKNDGVLELFLKFRRGTENRGFIRIKKKLSQKYLKKIDSF